MPKARNRNQPSQPSRQIQLARPDSDDPTRSVPAANPAASANSAASTNSIEPIDLSRLTFRQQAAIPIILASPSLSRAAVAAGIDENTLRCWLKEPLFADCLAAFRQQSVAIAHQEISGLTHRAMSVFADAMSDPDPAIRVRAARYALSYAVQISDVNNIGDSLHEMRQLLAQLKSPENAGN